MSRKLFGATLESEDVMNQNSPYETPKAAINISNDDASELNLASRWQRLANYLIDFAATMVIFTIFMAILMAIFGETAFDQLDKIPDILLGIALTLAYYLPFEVFLSKTPAKYITGTKVVDADGLTPSTRQIIGRTFSRLVPFEAFSFLGESGIGWHDRWSNTYVVRVR